MTSYNRTEHPLYNSDEQFASDTLAQWEPYFGKLDEYQRGAQGYGFGNGELRADAKARHESYNLPEAYKGKSRHLEDVLDYMRREEDDFYTRDLLPWAYTDDIHIQWQIFKFDRTLADIEPEQGIPRLVTAETDSRSDHLIRRGLAFQLEHGFMTTEQGRKHFVMNLRQITDAVHTTAHFGVMHALLTGKNHYKEWRKKYDRTPKRRHNVMKYEKGMWALLQKDLKGLYILDAEVKHDMKMNGVTPNVMVLPSKAGIYAHMVPSSETKYSERGQGAHEALASGSQMTTFRGSKVFEAASFDVDFTHENVDLLTRDRMIGEYFVMPGAPDSRIKIFCAEHDKFVEITKGQAARYALNGDDARFSGNLLHTIKGSHFTADDDVDNILKRLLSHKRWNNAAERAFNDIANEAAYDAAAGGVAVGIINRAVALLKLAHLVGELPVLAADAPGAASIGAAYFPSIPAGDQAVLDADAGLVGALGVAFNANEVDYIRGFQSEFYSDMKQTLRDAVDALNLDNAGNNAKITVGEAQGVANLVLACKGQERTQLRIHNEAITNDEADVNTKVLLFRPFSTWRMGSAIIAEGGEDLGQTWHGHHDFQLSDDVVRKTILGHYTFYSKSVVKRPKNYCIVEDVYASGYVSGGGSSFFTQQALENALEDQSIGTVDNRHSLIAWFVRSDQDFNKALDIFGKLPPSLREFDDDNAFHFPGAEQLQRCFEELDPYRDDGDYVKDSPHINTVCFRGAQMGVDANGDWKVTHLNQGHWGELTYDGCMGVREGRMVEMNKDKVLKIG
jgi:hypothetical protein